MVLIGRDPQRATLAGWLADRAAGVSGVPPALLVGGEAGVGKTALVRAATAGVGAVRWAAAVPWHPTPYGVLDQVVPALVRSPQDAPLDAGDVRAALVAGGEPLVLVLDDLHWCDDATLELLAPLVDALARDPVALVGAYRSDELPRGHALRRARTQMRHRRRLAELTLAPLDPTAIPDLVAAILGARPAAALVAAVADRTDGVPFVVEEMLAALAEAGRLVRDGDTVTLAAGDDLPLPDTVRDAVILRASGLSDPARHALDLAAVAGVVFDAATVGGLAGAGWPDELDHGGLVTVGPGDVRRFRHALTQEAIYAEVPWSRRRSLHLLLAQRLARTGGEPATVARHLLAAREFDRARPYLVAGADRYARAHAYRDAERLLRTALETWPPGTDEAGRRAVVDRLARCAEMRGDHPTAITCLRELTERGSSRPGSRPDGPAGGASRAQALRRLATQYELLGHWTPALAAREAAADAFTDADLLGDAAVERLAVAAHLRSAAGFTAALDALDAAATSAAAAERADLQCRIAGLRGNVLARMGRAAEGVPAVRTALDSALVHGLWPQAAEIYQRLADSLEHAGDYRGADRAYDRAYQFCQAHEQTAAGQLCRACATVVLFQGGRWDQALALCGQVLAEAAATAHARAVAYGVKGLVHALRGQVAAARPALWESRATARRIDLLAMELLSTWGLALVDEAGGEPERAATGYRHVVARVRETQERHYCLPVIQFAVARFSADGACTDVAAATAVLADAVATTGQAEARAGLAYALGESVLLDDGPDRALPHLRRAVDLLDGLELPLADVLVRYRTGLALTATSAGDLGPGLDLLAQAYRTAHRLRARPLVERIGADFDRLGARPVQPGGAGVLTAREAEVLDLVGRGLTSREIAQRLFLSTRTVEMHVRNAVARLGCRTRAEAVRRLANPSQSGAPHPPAGGRTSLAGWERCSGRREP